ncbi:CEL4a mannanase [Artomyces pyxidatus]|uniref:CEL4a mannanase n=1 Tax=Artomyces pyxidatus TaxID=48021 RepID=A0ACB8TCJ8_9AGAM|nr:CEL4a mannanase [Artomyces pyxidatus]
MLRFVSFVTAALSLANFVNAVAVWQQCGGLQYTGSTTCDAGLTCVELNAYYYQCQQLASSVHSSTPSPTSSSTISSVSSTSTSSAPSSTPTVTGFVTTSGQKFMLNGAEYTVVGANSYWVGLMSYSTANMNQAFSDIAKAGATTIRTWGFNEVTTPNGDYYQSWSGSTPTINTGATGLQNFDNVIAAAKAHGIRLIVALTNNWSDYGGMDVYVTQILGAGQPHDYFYTNAKVIAAYKNYIKTFVGRYVNEPGILGWELANEPRCSGSSPDTTSGNCTTTTITNWASQISAYIKSIDSNHLVAIGDEGFFNEPSNPSYPYQGSEGIDFNANIQIPTIDFGTFHASLYPVSYESQWGQSPVDTWGAQWIADHATTQKSANKPTLLEEFGVTSNQPAVYTVWYNEIISSGLSGDLIWQAGSHLSTGDTPQDGYAIYPDGPVFPLETSHAAALKARG